MAIGKLPDSDSDGDDSESIFAEINITPLTDVFLVLVIIFMVSALAVQVEARQAKTKVADDARNNRSGLKVNLPSGQAQEIDPSKASLVLVIPISGQVNVAGKIVTDDEVDRLFRAAYVRDKNTQVVLKADKGVPHGRVVDLMERAKQAGLTRLAIGTTGG
jgi:biopolymer transport protein ExbD